jgi:GDP-L-fucose synthase
MHKTDSIFVAGHRGMVGSAIVRRLQGASYSNLLLRSRKELDLLDARAVDRFFAEERPQYVFLAAAKVGGILANSTYPVDFLRENLLVELNVMEAAFRHGAQKVEMLGSSCIYPKMAPQPMREEYLLTGSLEPTNEWYAVAKIAGIKLAQAYRQQHGFSAISLMPTNLYGPGDNFDLQSSHVLPALIRKFHEAKESGAPEVVLWGTGSARRDLLHVDDMAEAAVRLMTDYDEPGIINIGSGEDLTISELANIVSQVVGFEGRIAYDTTKPDGTPRKLMDVSRLRALGWSPKIDLKEGIGSTYAWYLANAVEHARV